MNSHRYLLDTNILSHLIRNPAGAVYRHLEAALPATACTSIIVSCEIHFGIKKRVSDRLRRQAEQVLSVLDVLPLEPPVEAHYAEIRSHLNRGGCPIGGNDLLIAAHARCMNLILVTDNVREFSRVPALHVENWLTA